MGENRKFGYIRVSTADQNEARQIDAMRGVGIADRDIIIEKRSGKDFQREQYQVMKKFLRSGDVLYVTELDRLGRNKAEIMEEWRELTKVLGVDIVVMDMPLLDTTRYKDSDIAGIQSLVADITLSILAYFAEDERRRIKTRQAEGIKAAKARGKHLGRPRLQEPADFERYYTLWRAGKITAVNAIALTGLSASSFYRMAAKRKEKERERGE